MNFLLTLVLPETHEIHRQRLVNVALAQLAVRADAASVSRETGVRISQRSGAPNEVFQLLNVCVQGALDPSDAAKLAINAARATNDALRALGLLNTQVGIYIQVSGDGSTPSANTG